MGLGLLAPLGSCTSLPSSTTEVTTSTSTTTEVDAFIEVESSNVTLAVSSTATLTYTSSSEISYRLDNENLVSVTKNSDSSFTITSNDANGTTYLHLYLTSDETIYKDVLIVVGTPSSDDYMLGIFSGYRTEYYLGETPTFNDVRPFVYQDGSSVYQRLNRETYYFNIPLDQPFTEEGEYTIIITAPAFNYITTSFTINVTYNPYFTLTNSLEKVYNGDSYSMSFKTTYGAVLDISGIITKNENYFVNTYRDNFLIKNEEGIFIANYVYDDDGYYQGINASNGVMTSLYGGLTLNNAYDLLFGQESMEGILLEVDEENMYSDRYLINDTEVLSSIWNGVLGFNGQGNQMYLHANRDGDIIYTLEGQLSSGIALTFTGSIYDIGTACDSKIDAYLTSNYTVTSSADSTLSTMLSNFNSNNFTLNYGSTRFVFNQNYISIITSSSEQGYVVVDGTIHSYTVTSGSLTLGEEVTTMTSLTDFYLHPLGYDAFTTDLGHFFNSTYYGGYVNFNLDDVSDPISNYFSLQDGYTPLGLALTDNSTSTSTVIRLIIIYTSGSQLGMSYIQFNGFGTSQSSVVESYLASL